MGKKWNAYALFVENEFRRLKKRGENVSKPSLFAQLGEVWKNTPENIKAQYKEHAKKDNPFPIYIRSSSDNHDSSRQESSQPPPANHDLKYESPESRPEEPMLKYEPAQSSLDERFKIEPPPNVSEDRRNPSQKRHHDDHNGELDTHVKRPKLGVPGWCKNENDEKRQELRYKDFRLFQLRKQCETLVMARRGDFMSKPLLAISVNVLCQDNDGKFVPLEISIYSHDIKEGRLSEPFHAMIDPGDIPFGCNNVSKDHMSKHKIHYPFDLEHRPSYVRCDYKKIYLEMAKYCQAGDRTILIMGEQDLDQVRGSLEWLYEKATADGTKAPKPLTWSIFLIADYIAAIHNYIRQEMLRIASPKFALHYKLKQLLESGSHEHQSQYMCEYHRNPDRETVWCTRSCAIRTITNLHPELDEIHNLYLRATNTQLKITHDPKLMINSEDKSSDVPLKPKPKAIEF